MYSTIAQVTGAVINIVLDPIMIYGLLGCEALGVRGAAYATVIGQTATAICALALHLIANREIKSRDILRIGSHFFMKRVWEKKISL